jgi:hypothetical protein
MKKYFNIPNLIMSVIISIPVTIVINNSRPDAFVINFVFAYVGTMIGQKITEKKE